MDGMAEFVLFPRGGVGGGGTPLAPRLSPTGWHFVKQFIKGNRLPFVQAMNTGRGVFYGYK